MDLTVLAQTSERVRRSRMNHGDLVRDLADALRAVFTSGAMPPGTKLANEIVLAEQLKVSRPTLREALRILIHESHLETRRGIGTFVVRSPPHLHGQLDTLRSLSDFIAQTGAMPGIRDLRIRKEAASHDIAAGLGLSAGVPVAHVSRVRLADARPVAWAHEYLPLRDAVTFERVRRFDGASLYRFMRGELRLVLDRGELAITAVAARPPIAARLGLPVGEPLLLMREVVFDPAGRPLVFTVNHHNSAVAEFSLTRAGRPT